jgi:hypothetical protein
MQSPLTGTGGLRGMLVRHEGESRQNQFKTQLVTVLGQLQVRSPQPGRSIVKVLGDPTIVSQMNLWRLKAGIRAHACHSAHCPLVPSAGLVRPIISGVRRLNNLLKAEALSGPEHDRAAIPPWRLVKALAGTRV